MWKPEGSFFFVFFYEFLRFDSLYNQRQPVSLILGIEIREEEQINTEQIEVPNWSSHLKPSSFSGIYISI